MPAPAQKKPLKPKAPTAPKGPSAKSKTGNAACSAAASNWQLAIRGKASINPDTYQTLAKCRAMTRTSKNAEGRARAGYNLSDQGANAIKGRLQSRFDRNLITQKSRNARVKELLAGRKEKQAAAKATPQTVSPQSAKPTTMNRTLKMRNRGVLQPKPGGKNQEQSQTLDSNYAWARGSSVSNMGEDISSSARHLRNQWRGIEDAETRGFAESLITRDKLMKNEPHKLLEAMNERNSLNVLAAHLAIKSLPAKPENRAITLKSRHGTQTFTAEESRKAYYKAYNFLKTTGESHLNHSDPIEALKSLGATLRNESWKPEDQAYSFYLQKSYSNFQKRGNTGAYGQVSSLRGKIGKFNSATHSYELDADALTKAKTHVADFIGGKPLTEGPKRKASEGIKPGDAYLNTVVKREGGSQLTLNSHQQAADYLTKEAKVRGIQYGNSMTDDERKGHLIRSAQALKDLSLATKIPVSKLTLKGTLGLAYGARGKGNASAHYEPSQKVINLTRKSGAGALAHEWAHAVDHAASATSVGGLRKGQRKDLPYLSSSYRSSENSPQLSKAMDSFRKSSIDFTHRVRVQAGIDTRNGSKPYLGSEYWTSPEEIFARSFEAHTSRELGKLGIKNTYLSGASASNYMPSESESKQMAPALRKVMRAYRNDVAPGKNTTERNSLARDLKVLRNNKLKT